MRAPNWEGGSNAAVGHSVDLSRIKSCPLNPAPPGTQNYCPGAQNAGIWSVGLPPRTLRSRWTYGPAAALPRGSHWLTSSQGMAAILRVRESKSETSFCTSDVNLSDPPFSAFNEERKQSEKQRSRGQRSYAPAHGVCAWKSMPCPGGGPYGGP